ncbi:hypothetical protein [Citrobacter phage Ci1]|nr:hypothetical protein [Citrobacter phage Ci1]
MSKILDALIAHIENNNKEILDVKLYSLRQVIELMEKARIMERESINRDNHVIKKTVSPSREGIISRDDNPFMLRVLKGREQKPGSYKLKATGSAFVKGFEEEVFGSRPVKNQWNDTIAISKENVENALVIMLNRGAKRATVRDIVDVIKQFVPDAFDKNRKMIDYRHQVTKRFLSSEKKLLGRFESVKSGNEYIFNIENA